MNTAPSRTLGVALIGYGYAGKTIHAPLIRSVEGMRLTHVASSSPAKVHADLPRVIVVSDPAQLLCDPAIDLIVVATPNDTHFDLASAALDAGKHVVVDKPFVTSLDHARTLLQLAEHKRLVITVFQNRRWDADFLTVKQLLANDALGSVVQFESHFDRYRPGVRDRWRERDVAGGGLFWDLGPHLIDQALQLFGMPQAVFADLTAQRIGAKAVDYFHVLLRYPTHRAILHGTCLAGGSPPRYIVHGQHATYRKSGLDTQEDFLRSGKSPGDIGWGVDPVDGELASDGPPRTVATVPGDYRMFFVRMRDAILADAPPPVTPAEAIDVLRILECAIHSSELHAELPVGHVKL